MAHKADINRFRKKRIERFSKLIAPLGVNGHLHILDIGGTLSYWRALPEFYGNNSISITIVNLDVEEEEDRNLRIMSGDACNLPFEDNRFDVVHSNSVIEHVGHWHEMERMAAEIRRLAPSYFVQTPNVWFPIEPHFKLPFVHWLPEQIRAWCVQATGRARKFNDAAEATLYVQRISLLSAAQFQCLFPDSTIWRERVMGFSKSLIAERFQGPII